MYYQNESMKNKMQAEKSETAYNLKLEEFHKAEGLNEDFQKLEEKERQLLELSERIPIFKEKEKQLEHANRAGTIEVYENQANEWREDEKEKQQKLIDAEKKQAEAVKRLEEEQKRYEIEDNKKAYREELGRTIRPLP